MPSHAFGLEPRKRLIGVVTTMAVHLVLFGGWMLTRPVRPADDGARGHAITWIDIKQHPAPRVAPAPIRPSVAASAPVNRPERPAARASKEVSEPVDATASPPPEQSSTTASAPPQTQIQMQPPPQTPVTRSADDIMQQARRDLGKIDHDLKKQFPERTIRAPVDTAQKRLEQGIELANEMAPPKWYEAPKIREVVDPGGYGRRRYRVITAQGTYCLTYESINSPNGRDPTTRGSAPKMTTCDDDEQPAKAQAW